MEKSFDIAQLIDKFIRKEISEGEKTKLDEWINASSDNKQLFEKLTTTSYQLSKAKLYNQFDSQKSWKQIEPQIGFRKQIPLFSRKAMKFAAAILLPLFVVGGLSFYFFSNQNKIQNIAQIDQFVKPGVEKATLILSNGNELDLSQKQKDIEEKGTHIAFLDKRLQYNSDKQSEELAMPVFNQLITPKGGTYSLQLADGTKVILNAESELQFPVDFTDSVRSVYLKGEAYFDVAHNGKPFVVEMENADVRVLGTIFNIAAYDDEQQITTTLVEGKVAFETNVEEDIQHFVLTPGLQPVMEKTNENIVVNEVNTSSYTSWVNGKLEFNKVRLELVMKKLARWYDFDYEFKNLAAKDYHFTARFDRTNNISEIFEILELTTNVKFEIENDTIVIL